MSVPCPFCGSLKFRCGAHAPALMQFVECVGCFARGPLRTGNDWANAAWSVRPETRREATLMRLVSIIDRNLDAERAKLRRWQLRLRWRTEHRDSASAEDRLQHRAAHHPAYRIRVGRPDWTDFRVPLLCHLVGIMKSTHRLPISGPRGVLP